MKQCCMCKLDKSLKEFSKNKRKKDNLNSHCKTCHRDYRKRHYQINKSKVLVQVKSRKRRWLNEIRELKNKPCTDCHKKYPYYVMQFDHRPEYKKKFLMAYAWKYSKEKVLAEAKKCDVVCANCHAERTQQRLRD